NKNTIAQEAKTYIMVKVVNLKNEAIVDAKVVVVETNKSYFTGADGISPQIALPFNGKGSWDSVTLAIFKDGYVDYVLYNCIIYPQRTRIGPVIKMFDNDDGAPEMIVFTENPPDDITKDLIRRLRTGK
ncbi:MAG: hypothetical protein RR307_03175, partial [Clostridia bacterium]